MMLTQFGYLSGGIFIALAVANVVHAQCDECRELVAAVRLNSSGILRYDVLVEYDSSLVGEKSQTDHQQSWIRLMLDSEKKIALRVVSEFKVDSQGNRFDRSFATFVSEVAVIDMMPGKKDDVRKTKSFLDGRVFGGIYSLELAGIQFFPPVYYYTSYSTPDIESQWSRLEKNAFDNGKMLDVGEEIWYSISSVSSVKPEVEYVSKYEFDSVSRMPLSKLLAIRDPKDHDRSRNLQYERTKWFRYEGIYLPHKIIGDKLRNPLPNETQAATQDTQVRFYWLSVNQPLTEDLLTPEYWRDPSHIRDATSPKLVDRCLNLAD